MFLLMLFMFFFFLGSITMFLCLVKKIDAQTRALGDEHAQMRVLLRAMESRLDKISQIERLNAMFQGHMDPDAGLPGENAGEDDSAGHDPLLHLSFDEPHASRPPLDPGLDLNLQAAPTWTMPGNSIEKNA